MKNGAPLPLGHLLDGRYRIHKVLGVGGMGRVYLANDTRLANRPVAAKEMIVGDGIQERKAIDDFNREASVLARLSHPSIPQVIDYFAEQGRYYLVMEYVAGGDLQHRLDEMGAGAHLPEAEVLRMARQLLDVMQFLHGQNPPIVYRDLKPANIMIDQHGRAMLIDFGIARFLPPGGHGTQIGSIGYAPPEQYLGKMEPRSDLYALAATMHHLLTGRDPQLEPPFSFPPVHQLAPQISARTADVVMAALDKDIARRPQSAREMRDALPNPELVESAEGLTTAIDRATEPKPAIGSMATIVLNQPIAPSRSPTPRSLVSPALKPSAAPPKPPVDFLAQFKTQRQMNLPSPAKPAAAVPSPTAKTTDLGLKKQEKSIAPDAPAGIADEKSAARQNQRSRVAAALASMRTAISVNSSVRSTQKSSGSAPAEGQPKAQTDRALPGAEAAPVSLNGKVAYASAAAGAWLVSVAERMQFGLVGTRIIVGRAKGDPDGIDVDLSRLRHGADRISRRHAEIVKQGEEYFIRDLGSINGTYVAGRGRLGRDQLYKLKNRDELVLGGAKLEFRRG